MCHVLLLASPAVKSPAFNRHRVCEDTGPRLRDLPLQRCPGWCDEGHSDKLQRVLNAAARLITGTSKFDRGLSQLLHSDLHWLDVPQRVQYKLGVTYNAPLSATQSTSVPGRLLYIGRRSSRSSTSAFHQPSAVRLLVAR